MRRFNDHGNEGKNPSWKECVVIGDGCEIDLLEYVDECKISGRSSVKGKRKVTA